MKLGRTFAVGLFVFVLAVTPLNSLLNGGVFETWLPSEYNRGAVRVLVHDQTGLVMATATHTAYAEGPQPQRRVTDPRLLVIAWQACGGQVDLTFSRTESGYMVAAPSAESGWCSFFTPSHAGLTALSLRAPVDAESVIVTSEFDQ